MSFLGQGKLINKIKKIKHGNIVTLGIWLYVLACATPVATTSNEVLFGIQCLLMGPMSILAGDLLQLIIWGSNPLFYFAIKSYRMQHKTALIFAILTVITGCLMFFHLYVTCYTEVQMLKYQIGFYFWIVSYVLALKG